MCKKVGRMNFEDQIASLDVRLFGVVPTATSVGDQRSLLRLQRYVRNFGSYVYLEIGSHLGGTIQQHLADSRCRLIYSIDKRPLVLPDAMRGSDHYPGNSTKRMLTGLREALPGSNMDNIKTFDCDASEIDGTQLLEKADFCFIDGEHTNRAVYSDFQFCLRACQPDGIIALHDANIIYGGIKKIKRILGNRAWKGYVLPDNIYVFLLNDAARNFETELREVSRAAPTYMIGARWTMFKAVLGNRFPKLRAIWRATKGNKHQI
jgi:hypothetical protein